MNEMKLEEIDLLTDSSYLFVCLKNYLRSGTISLTAYEERELSLRKEAERIVDANLNGWKKIVYVWALRNARRAVRNRENTRFARTRAYGVARSMFQSIGKDLAGRGILISATDIFYLNLEEVYGIYQGTLTCTNLKDFVGMRKQQYAEYEKEEPSPRFLTRSAVYWQNRFEIQQSTAANVEGADLVGLPCCPGIVEGIVKVISSAKEDLTLQGEILVAARTDPGWVPLYPSISGLLVERGSLLSHSAIVAREMGIPTIVGINGLCNTLKSGMKVRMNGEKGTIEIIN
jgi:pyruvate,water dikinase